MTQLETDLNYISSLPDQPAMTTAALKQEFDKAGNVIKNFINQTLEPEITSNIASCLASAKAYSDAAIAGINLDASNISFDGTESGLEATNVQDATDEMKGVLDTSVSQMQALVSTRISYTDFETEEYDFTVKVHSGNTNIVSYTQSKAGYYPLTIISMKSTGMASGCNYPGALGYPYMVTQSVGSVTYTVMISGTSSELALFGQNGKIKILWVKAS